MDEGLFGELEQDFVNYALHFSLWNLNTLAEPTHEMLKNRLCEEWFRELGIEDKPQDYFYDPAEYAQYKWLVGRNDMTEEERRVIQNQINGTDRLSEKMMSVQMIGKISPYVPKPLKRLAIRLLAVISGMIKKGNRTENGKY